MDSPMARTCVCVCVVNFRLRELKGEPKSYSYFSPPTLTAILGLILLLLLLLLVDFIRLPLPPHLIRLLPLRARSLDPFLKLPSHSVISDRISNALNERSLAQSDISLPKISSTDSSPRRFLVRETSLFRLYGAIASRINLARFNLKPSTFIHPGSSFHCDTL